MPKIQDITYKFRVYGLYNGLAIMIDDRTQSKWEHVQGESIDGEWQGHMLETRQSLHYMTAEQALKIYPDTQIAISRPSFMKKLLHALFLRRMTTEEGYLPFMFSWSMQEEDIRRERMELGLGIWTEDSKCSRFYPMSTIKAQNNVFIDTLAGQRFLIYIDPQSGSPTAIATQAHDAKWVEDAIILDTGEIIRNGQIYSDTIALKAEKPKQLFTRWYGFAYTFPSCSIYE